MILPNRLTVCFISFLILLSCNRAHSKTEIEEAMNQYDRLIKKMDADSIALMFTTDGNLGNISHGQDSIKRFLATFKNISVLSTSSTTASINLNGDTAIQKGMYHQVAVIDGKDTMKVQGEFVARWKWLAQHGWRIQSMITKPEN